MKEFLEKSLQQNVTIIKNKELYKKLPLVFKERYTILMLKLMAYYGWLLSLNTI